jgi:hypothetical protein
MQALFSCLILMLFKEKNMINLNIKSGDMNIFPRKQWNLIFGLAPPDIFLQIAMLATAKRMGCTRLSLVSS